MLHTFETRLPVDDALSALLADNASHWSWGLRKAWSLLDRQGLSRTGAYAQLTKDGFTSEQVGSLLTAAEMRQASLVELKAHEQQQLRLAITKREQALAQKRKKIAALEKQQLKLRIQRDKAAPKPVQVRSDKYRQLLDKLRAVTTELDFCHNWVAQKSRVLAAKQGALKTLTADIAAGRYSLCFGSKKLLAQRPGDHNRNDTPFETVTEWRQAWDTARNGQWWSVGKTAKPQGNAEIQWFPETQQLRLRLTDRVAEARMMAREVLLTGGKAKDMSARMACRFIVLDGVNFTSHKGAACRALAEAFGRQPVTMRVLKRLQADGTVAWYLQASIDVDTQFDRATAARRENGVLGLDFNAAGVAWCVTKPDGNRLVVRGPAQQGFLSWDLTDRTDAKRKQAIGTVVQQLASMAEALQVAVAMENLDFSTKKLVMRAGAVNKPYNAMLSSLATSQFADLMARACEKRHVILHSVNPAYSSVGWVKYGRLNRCTVDEAAAHWLARQAIFGTIWKTDGAVQYVKKHDEKLVFPHLSATRMQRMKARAGVQWRDVYRGLGKNRRQWGRKFRAWFEAQVDAASSPMLSGEPVLVI